MRFDIRYHTRFGYERPVQESHNELRACPASDDRQRLVAYRVAVAPSARVLSYTDYWGTRVDAFGVRPPHRALEVVAEATVETRHRAPVTAAPRIDAVEEPAFFDRHAEYLAPTRHTDWDEAIAREAQELALAYGPDLVGVVLAIHRRVRTALVYDPGATEVATPLPEVWRGRAGVCQDFAHLAVAMCRAVGVPARYVSGYLFSAADDRLEETDEESVRVQTHAWFEAALPGGGWLPLDPTNGRDVGVRHVKIGHGRDYDDVAPFHGCHLVETDVTLDAGVEIRRGDAPPLDPTPDAAWADTEPWAARSVAPPVPDLVPTRVQHQYPRHAHQQQQQQQ